MRRIAPQWSLGVLSGGESRRMGRDKAQVPFLGRPMIEHLVARLAPEGVPILVSTRPGGADPPARSRRVDDREPGLGPLAGISALLDATTTPFLLVVPCDLPNLPAETGDRLLHYVRGSDAVLLLNGANREPFPALLSADLAPVIADLLSSGERRADCFHERVRACVVPMDVAFPGVDPVEAFMNVNDAETLAIAERMARSRRG